MNFKPILFFIKATFETKDVNLVLYMPISLLSHLLGVIITFELMERYVLRKMEWYREAESKMKESAK